VRRKSGRRRTSTCEFPKAARGKNVFARQGNTRTLAPGMGGARVLIFEFFFVANQWDYMVSANGDPPLHFCEARGRGLAATPMGLRRGCGPIGCESARRERAKVGGAYFQSVLGAGKGR
jgi:hypothetical protein